MGALRDNLGREIASLQVDKDRITAQAAQDVAAVQAKLDALRAARQALTPAVEASYDVLINLGIVVPVKR